RDRARKRAPVAGSDRVCERGARPVAPRRQVSPSRGSSRAAAAAATTREAAPTAYTTRPPAASVSGPTAANAIRSIAKLIAMIAVIARARVRILEACPLGHRTGPQPADDQPDPRRAEH